MNSISVVSVRQKSEEVQKHSLCKNFNTKTIKGSQHKVRIKWTDVYRLFIPKEVTK